MNRPLTPHLSLSGKSQKRFPLNIFAGPSRHLNSQGSKAHPHFLHGKILMEWTNGIFKEIHNDMKPKGLK